MRFPSTQNSNSNWIRIICECECVYTVAVASGDVMFSSTTCIDYMYDCMSCESNFVHETSIKRRKHICIQPKCVCIFATKNTFYQFYWFSGFDRISSKKKQTSAQTCFCFGFKPNQTKPKQIYTIIEKENVERHIKWKCHIKLCFMTLIKMKRDGKSKFIGKWQCLAVVKIKVMFICVCVCVCEWRWKLCHYHYANTKWNIVRHQRNCHIVLAAIRCFFSCLTPHSTKKKKYFLRFFPRCAAVYQVYLFFSISISFFFLTVFTSVSVNSSKKNKGFTKTDTNSFFLVPCTRYVCIYAILYAIFCHSFHFNVFCVCVCVRDFCFSSYFSSLTACFLFSLA